ncbi:Sporulation domain-containing protein OS=Streptomyces albaduncus OX=68172 GN=FHS32_003126 PE=4 SV=1 [Streptomyces griseoloalbus]
MARSLGLRDAVNLDGGGSTTMVANGRVINAPSDAAGERPVGDALLVLPRKG